MFISIFLPSEPGFDYDYWILTIDGQYITEQVPETYYAHLFNNPGSYTVVITYYAYAPNSSDETICEFFWTVDAEMDCSDPCEGCIDFTEITTISSLNCDYQFQAKYLEGECGEISIISEIWDFGFLNSTIDNSSTTGQIVSQSFPGNGTYTVTTEIIYQVDGSEDTCKVNQTLEVEVTDCIIPLPICNFHLCWSVNSISGAPSMQGIEDIIGVNVVDANGTTHTIQLFSSPLDISGQFTNILNTLMQTLTAPPFNLATTDVTTDSTNCFKGKDIVDGFSVNASFQSLSFYGLDDNGNPIEIFFEQNCCFPEIPTDLTCEVITENLNTQMILSWTPPAANTLGYEN